MTLSFKARLTLGHLAAVVLILVGTALMANWALSRAVLSQVIDGAILALAETEAAAMVEKPHPPTHIHEMAVLRQNLIPPQWPTADALATGQGTFRRL